MNRSSGKSFVGQIFGSWKCESQLGTGSFGIVHVWNNKQTKETIALKKCRFGPEVLLSDKHKEQWRQEVDIMLRLDHPNVVKCYPTPADLLVLNDIDEPLPMLCMEFCSGGDLRKVLNQTSNCFGLEQIEVLNCVSDLTSALGFLHNRRIIHRDLKPENVVQKLGQRTIYKLIDLGYAKELGQSSLALSFVGTLQYIAPELFLSHEYTKSVDYWSLGFLCFEIVTGRRPFLPNLSPGQWMDHVQSKTSRQICIYQSEPDGGEIIFRETLFDENFLSSSVARDLESWLRLLLEWDPTKRGRDINTGKIGLFIQLENILSKPRIRLVAMTRSESKLDFEFSESTPVSELSSFVSGKLGFEPGNFELLTLSGSVLRNPESQLFSNELLQDGVIFVVETKKLSSNINDLIKNVTLRIPETIQPFLQNPRQNVNFPKKRQIFSHSYFFVRTEQKICVDFEVGLKSFQTFLNLRLKKLNSELMASSKLRDTSLAKIDLFQESLRHDVEKYEHQAKKKDHITSNQMYESWITSEVRLVEELSNLERKFEKMKDDVKAFSLRLSGAQHSKKKSLENLGEFEEVSLKKLDELKRIPLEGRKEMDTVLDMAQLFVKCLKQRDRFLREYFPRYIELVDLHNQMSVLHQELLAISHGFESLSHNTTKMLKRRQSDIWKLLAAAVSQSNRPGPTVPSFLPHELLSLSAPQASLLLEQSILDTERDVLVNEELRSQMSNLLTSQDDLSTNN